MKLSYFIQENAVQLHLTAETQKESADLIEICNSMPKSIEAYGAVGQDNTWARIKLPTKKVSYRKGYFGNLRD